MNLGGALNPTANLAAIKQDENLKIWTPRGMVDPKLRAAQRVVEQYDPNLMLARHEGTGDWCVFLTEKASPFGLPFPVIGLGPELPPPDEIEKRLMQADTARRGREILDQLERKNAAIKADREARMDDASGIAAEALEWGFRKQGAHPSPRIFVPRSL